MARRDRLGDGRRRDGPGIADGPARAGPSAEAKAKPDPSPRIAWNRLDRYDPPDFDGFFPDDPEGGKALDAAWDSAGMRIVSKPRELGDADFALVRKGLRRTSVDRAKVLQWMSYGMWRTVPGKENMPFAPRQPQAAAVEIMYHAADPKPEADRYGTRYNAVYFGLSQVQPKPPNVLHALADLAMTTEDSQLLGRIVASLTWGPSQQEAFLEFIKSYEQSREPRARDEAALLRKIVNQEEEPAVLAVRRDRARAKARFGDRLPAIEATLRSGSPADRLETLRLIRKERIFWIMEDSSIPAFALAATDRDPEVRKAVAEVVGLRFLWNESPSPEAAIDLVMRMSFNEELPVRRSVVRYGLAP